MKNKITIFLVQLILVSTVLFLVLSNAFSSPLLTLQDTTVSIIYLVNGEPHKLTRPLPKTFVSASEKDRVVYVLQEFIKGPNADEQKKGIKSAIPRGATINKFDIDTTHNHIFLHLQIPKENLKTLDVLAVDNFYDSLGKTLYGIATSFRVTVIARDETTGKYKPLSDFLPPLPPQPKKPDQEPSQPQSLKEPPPIVEAQGQPAGYGQGQPTGALTGKTVFISAGHGWYYEGGTFSNSTWRTQRGNTYSAGIVEDLSNIDAVNNYLIQYLWNAGANVWPCRARSRDTAAFIVDNDTSGYTATGSWSLVTTTGTYGGTHRQIAASTSPTATATWRPTISTAGFYPVYVWYRSGSDRVTDARYTVVHSGGTTDLVIHQQRDGWTWKWLGTYYFDAGTTGFVRVTNQSASPTGKIVVADAARFGDGFGSISRGSVTSGQLKQDECSRYWAEYMGAPSSVYDTAGADNSDDVTCRPRYANWENESWEDPVYISWHTNATPPGTGTESYIWSTTWGWGQPTPVDDGPATPGSYSFMTCVHKEIINDIRRAYDASWTDRGMMRNDYGELRPLSSMPGAIFEMAFHDNTTKDIPYLLDPNFRQIIARAVYQGIVKYFANRDALPINLLPEPPTHLRVVNTGTGSVQLTWCAPTTDAVNLVGGLATSYRVYRSTNGYGFDNGLVSSATTITISGLTPDQVYFFRVSAVNTGGESFPSNTLAVRVKSSGTASILIVDGFDRMDNTMMPKIRSKSVYQGSDNGYPNRQYMELVNSYNYSIQHANAITNATTAGAGRFYFDSASNEAVASELINLANYKAVIWLTGKESTADETFSSGEQTRVTTFLNSGYNNIGGRLFVSGSEIGWDLGRTAGSADSTFYANYLKAGYAGDDSNTDTIVPFASGIFAGLSNFVFDTGRGVTYFVDYPDQLRTFGGSSVCLTYSGGAGGTAGIQYWSSTTKVVNFGFPFETILDSSARNTVMQRILSFLLPPRLRTLPTSLSFTAQQGGANPAPQSLTIYNDGEGIMSWSATTNQPWLSVSPTSGVATADIPRTIQVSVNIAGLSFGTFTGRITITASGAETSPQYGDVILTVTPQPNLRIDPSSLFFSAPTGGSNPTSKTLTIYNDGTGTMNWSAITSHTWVSISPASGSIIGAGSQPTQVSVNISGLAVGTTYSSITVSAPGALNTPRTCTITLVITPPLTSLDYDWRLYPIEIPSLIN
ncbi:MAG: fibronectin type III domain-containing protein [bacterium]|nr:fibronectin type III domain-containing protein [bacterium]